MELKSPTLKEGPTAKLAHATAVNKTPTDAPRIVKATACANGTDRREDGFFIVWEGQQVFLVSRALSRSMSDNLLKCVFIHVVRGGERRAEETVQLQN